MPCTLPSKPGLQPSTSRWQRGTSGSGWRALQRPMIDKSWFAWLFGRSQGQSPAPEMPNELNTSRIQAPQRRGRTPEQRAEDQLLYQQEMRAKFKAISQRDRRRAIAAGLTHYIWRSASDEAVCTACAKKSGKRFVLNNRPRRPPRRVQTLPTGLVPLLWRAGIPQRVSSSDWQDC